MKDSQKIILSASKLSTLNKCSFVYYMVYIMGIKGDDNDGSKRGTIVHTVFECLLKPRHRHHYDKIIEDNDIINTPVYLLVHKLMKKIGLGVFDNKKENNFELINSMIFVGLKSDFYCQGKQLEKAEHEFYYEGLNYIIRGAIDKIAREGENYEIHDYKSSSQKYTGEELEFNVQSMIYSLLFYKQRGVIPFFRFIFLRFADDPFIDKQFTEEEIKGFEEYLIYISNYLKNYDYKKAVSNLAASKGYPTDGSFSGLLACGYSKYPGHIKPKTGELYFSCSFKHPKTYYYILDKKGEVKKCVDTKNKIELGDGESIKEWSYQGCPYWYPNSYE